MNSIIFIYFILSVMLFNAYQSNKENAVFTVDIIKGVYFGADANSITTEDAKINYVQVIFLCFAFTVKYIDNE